MAPAREASDDIASAGGMGLGLRVHDVPGHGDRLRGSGDEEKGQRVVYEADFRSHNSAFQRIIPIVETVA
jgi:hypothetical protein